MQVSGDRLKVLALANLDGFGPGTILSARILLNGK